MKNVFANVLECVGNTPLIRINRLNPNPKVTLYAKLEAVNPGGSIKDRAALSMIESAERSGELTPGKIIIEATSGNTGIGLAMVAAVKGYRILLAMPETASMERQKILRALGAELLLTPGALGTDGAIEEVYRLVREDPERYYMADQFNNQANVDAHYHGTGPEIYQQTDGKVSAVVCALGTTGTAMGLVRALKERDPKIEVVAVEPYQGHKIQGLKNMKESYMPGIFDRRRLDRIVHVKDEEAFETARRLAKEEGLFVGMSSGAVMAAAIHLAEESTTGVIVAVFPDGGERYLSTNLFTTMLEPDFSFFDFRRRQKVDFKPVREGQVRISVTAPPLDRPLTLNEARRFVAADLLVRFLGDKGFATQCVVWLPDLDSQAAEGSLAADMSLEQYSQARRRVLLDELQQINISDQLSLAAASDHVDAILENTRALLNKGVAYEKLRSVYFSLNQVRDYGVLSRMDPQKIRVGSTVDLDAYEKLNPRDFTLLKRATLAQLKRGLYLKTEWGSVLPTWNIEAAAIAMDVLGTPIDIQLSSVDFLFPHLENVRAIGEALGGKTFANLWMLCERVWYSKASNADNDFADDITVRELLRRGYHGGQIRYWLLATQYRKPIQATEANLGHAVHSLQRIQEFINRVQYAVGSREEPKLPEYLFALEQNFFDALSTDLNTPKALAALFKFIRQVNPLLDAGAVNEKQRQAVLDVLNRINRVLALFRLEESPLDESQRELLELRDRARRAGNWEEADRIRDQLQSQGITLIDTAQGTRWKRTTRCDGPMDPTSS